jgi:hypothetical protein
LLGASCFTMKPARATFTTYVMVPRWGLCLENTISSCHQQSYTSLLWCPNRPHEDLK